MNLFKSPFEKLALQELKGINDNSFVLVSTLTSGGELFSIFKNMEKYLKMIANGETKEKKGGGLFGNRNTVLVKVSNASAKALGVGLDGIGEGLKKIAEALQMVGDSSEAQKRMGVLILGIKQIEQLGKAIFKFGLWMVGATVLLAIGSVGVGLFALQMYTLYTIFDLLDKNKFDQKVNTAVPALKDAAIGVAITGLALATFAVIVAIVNNPLAALGLMALTIVTVAGIFWLAGNFAPQIALGATAMLEASFAVGIIALSTALFAAFVPPNADGFTTIGQIGLAILTVGTVMALAGIPPVPALIVAGAGSMIFAGLAIILIGLGISMFAKAISGSESIFEDSGHATKGFSVLGIQIIEGGRPMSKIEWALLSIARSFMLPPAAIASMYVGAPAMIMAGMALWWVGTGIKKFQDLKIDYGVLGKQIGKAVYAIADAFGEIGAKYPGSGPTFSTIFLGDYSGASPVYQGIKAVHGMGKALSGIAMGIQYMSDLKFPTAWDKNGNPTQFRTLKDACFAPVTTNTQMIVKSLSETFGEIGSSDAANDSWGWFGHSAIEEGIQIARDFAEPLMGLAKFINEFGKIKVDTALVTKKTQDIIFAMTGTFGQVGAMPEAEDNWGWFGNSVIEEGISIVTGIAEPLFKLAEFVKIFNETDVDTTALITKSQNIISAMASIFAGEGSMKFDANTRLTMTTIANSYGRMATSMEDWKESINDLDLEKVTEVRKLYEGLAYLSKNNGDTLIEDLGESLIEAIEALSEALAKFGGQGGGSTAPAAAPASSSTAGSKPAGATGGNPESYAELLEAVNLMKSRLEGTLTVALAPGTVLSNG